MSRTTRIVLVLLGAAFFIGVLIYSTFGLRQVRCEVCMEYRGREQCRGAVGANEQEATSTAIRNACAFIASGRDETIACLANPPVSIVCE